MKEEIRQSLQSKSATNVNDYTRRRQVSRRQREFLGNDGFHSRGGHCTSQLRNYESASDRERLHNQALLRLGVARNFELKFRTKKRIAFRTLLSSAELLELGGKNAFSLHLATSVNEKRLSRNSNATSEILNAYENSPDIIARLDPDLLHLYQSGLERATGLSTDRFIRKNCRWSPWTVTFTKFRSHLQEKPSIPGGRPRV